MPFKKGDPKPPNSGKKKGCKHVTLASTVRERLLERGHDPVTGLIDIAEDEHSSPELRAHVEAKLCRFVYPELRSIEHSGPGGGPIQHAIDPLDAIASELTRLAGRTGTSADTPKTQH